MTKRTLPEIKAEIKELQEIDNKTSDRVQHELNVMDEKEKEHTIKTEKVQTEYHKLKATDLPIYKKQEWKYKRWEDGIENIITKWLYKLSVENGKLICQRIVIGDNRPCELQIDGPESILDSELIPSTKEEWQTATSKILTQLDKPTK
jgi:hypothetical protein